MRTQKHVILVVGKSTTGKTASLRNIKNPERVAFLACEADKQLPFKAGKKFHRLVITDPYQVPQAIEELTGHPDFDYIIIDTLSFLLQMFYSVHIHTSKNKQNAWGELKEFFINLMQDTVTNCDKTIIFLAHTKKDINPDTNEWETTVPVQGSTKDLGVEAYFDIIVATKILPLNEAEKNQKDNSLLNITDWDKAKQIKYCYQTQLTPTTTGERIRSPMDMFSLQETYIDNDIQILIDRLDEFYA